MQRILVAVAWPSFSCWSCISEISGQRLLPGAKRLDAEAAAGKTARGARSKGRASCPGRAGIAIAPRAAADLPPARARAGAGQEFYRGRKRVGLRPPTPSDPSGSRA